MNKNKIKMTRIIEPNKLESSINKNIRYKVLRIDNKIVMHSMDISEFKEKIDKINKRIDKKKEKGILSEGVETVSYKEKSFIESGFPNLINDVKENLEEYRGRVSYDERQLYYADGEPNQTVLFILSQLYTLGEESGFDYMDNNFIVLELDSLNIGNTNEWDVLGVIKPTDETYVTMPFLGNDVPDKYKRLSNDECANCDHCQTNRERNNVFILKNKESGETKQVGGKCLQDFVDTRTLDEKLKIHEALFTNTGFRHKSYFNAKKVDILAASFAILESDGVYKKGDQHEVFGTIEKAKMVANEGYKIQLLRNLRLMVSGDKRLKPYEKKDFIERHEKSVDVKIEDSHYERAEKLINDYKNSDQDIATLGFHEGNTQRLMDSDSVFVSYEGKVGYYVIAVNKQFKEELKQSAEDKMKSIENEYDEIKDRSLLLAPEKTKIDRISAKITSVKESFYESYHGTSHAIKINMVTDDGVFCQASTQSLNLPNDFFDESDKLKDVNKLNKEFAGKYFTMAGSVSKNFTFEGDSGEIIQFSKLRINKAEPELTDERTGELLLKEKYIPLTGKLIDKKRGISYKRGSDLVDTYQYTFETSDGISIIMNKSNEIDGLEIGNNYKIGAQLVGVKDSEVWIQPIQDNFFQEIDELSPNVFSKEAEKTLLQIKKDLGIKNPKQRSSKKIK